MKRIIFNFCFVWLAVSAFAGSKVVEMRNYGLVPDTHENLSAKLQKALQDIKTQVASGDKVTLLFESGRYDFHPEGAAVREYYISNHDQDNPKTVGFPLEDWKGLTVDGQTDRILAFTLRWGLGEGPLNWGVTGAVSFSTAWRDYWGMDQVDQWYGEQRKDILEGTDAAANLYGGYSAKVDVSFLYGGQSVKIPLYSWAALSRGCSLQWNV